MTRVRHSLPKSQSQKPLPAPLAMSTTTAEPSSSPVPAKSSLSPSPIPRKPSGQRTEESKVERPRPKTPSLPAVKLRLRVNDLTHPGALIFFNAIHPINALADAVTVVLQTLYTPFENTETVPSTRSVSLVLRPFKEKGAVAYTTGSELDDDDNEIHINLAYLELQSKKSLQGQRDEISGVLVHEMVHCWQWNASGTAPGGLCEGIADFVRLRAGLSPPHWKKVFDCDWDAGYERTGYFLEWIEKEYGEGSIMRINEKLRTGKYEEKKFWYALFKSDVHEMWKKYTKASGKEPEIDKSNDTREEVKDSAKQHE